MRNFAIAAETAAKLVNNYTLKNRATPALTKRRTSTHANNNPPATAPQVLRRL